MPDIVLTFTLTQEQESTARAWCALVQPKDPKLSLEEFLRAQIIDTVRSGIRSMETPPDKSIWRDLTDDQRARIKAIIAE